MRHIHSKGLLHLSAFEDVRRANEFRDALHVVFACGLLASYEEDPAVSTDPLTCIPCLAASLRGYSYTVVL